MSQSTNVPHELDVIDLTAYLNGEGHGDLPKRVLESLRNTSCLVVKDPRVTEQQNEDFLDLMESYFSLPREQKMKDARPELSYQVGFLSVYNLPKHHAVHQHEYLKIDIDSQL
jgi:isopenicillin N synthase-like dioxygenase